VDEDTGHLTDGAVQGCPVSELVETVIKAGDVTQLASSLLAQLLEPYLGQRNELAIGVLLKIGLVHIGVVADPHALPEAQLDRGVGVHGRRHDRERLGGRLGERSYPVAGNLSKLALRKTLQIVQKALDISAVPDGLPDREVEGCAVGDG
jgi:hypothetical protein